LLPFTSEQPVFPSRNLKRDELIMVEVYGLLVG